MQTGRSQYVRVSSHIFGQTEQGVADWEKVENNFRPFRAYAPYESAESLLSGVGWIVCTVWRRDRSIHSRHVGHAGAAG